MANILVIEDQQSIGMVLKLVLSDHGYSVEVVPNGKLGLERLYMEPRPEVVIVDLNIPVISGRELLELMRNDVRLNEVPVIIISGSAQTLDIMPSEGSYQAFISKPFDLFDVLEKVNRLVRDASSCCT